MSEQNLRFAIVTCSDTRSMKEDTAGAALAALVAENGWECASHVVVKDERADIAAAIVHACDEVGADIRPHVRRQRSFPARRDARGHARRVRARRARHC